MGGARGAGKTTNHPRAPPTTINIVSVHHAERPQVRLVAPSASVERSSRQGVVDFVYTGTTVTATTTVTTTAATTGGGRTINDGDVSVVFGRGGGIDDGGGGGGGFVSPAVSGARWR